MSGTVSIARTIWQHPAFKDEPMTEREAFIWLVMEASYKSRERRVGAVVVSLDRGQLAASVRFMCAAWGWSKSKVDRFLKRLENRDMIGTDSGTGVNVITICNYDKYQFAADGGGTGEDKKRDSSGTAAGQQRDKPKKEEIKGKKDAGKTEYDPLCVLCEVASEGVVVDFIAHRKELKKPVTERAARAIVKKLVGHPDPDAVLLESIANGWQGIFPEKVKPRQKDKPNGQQLAERAAARFAAMDSGESANPSKPLLPAEHPRGRDRSGSDGLDQGFIRLFSGPD